MKGMKGKFLKKLKSIKPLGAIKQGRVLLVRAADGLLDPSSPHHNTNGVLQNPSKCTEKQQIEQNPNLCNPPVMEHEVIDVSELMRDLEDREMGFEDSVGNKENVGPKAMKVNDLSVSDKENMESDSGSYSFRSCSTLSEILSAPSIDDSGDGVCEKPFLEETQLSEFDELGFRRPKLNSSTLFDPNLLAAFEEIATEHMRTQEAIRRARIEEKKVEKEEEPPSKTRRIEECPLLEFEERCPPGGSESVILYTTSLRGIRKTFEDCNKIMFLLESFRIKFVERDVSMHLEFREEMWRILGERVVPPRLFIKGRYIGGADEVVGLHERGSLLELFEGMPRDQSSSPCDGCGGMHFVLCSNCNGSCKHRAIEGEDDCDLVVQCSECNENGLIVCTVCC